MTRRPGFFCPQLGFFFFFCTGVGDSPFYQPMVSMGPWWAYVILSWLFINPS